MWKSYKKIDIAKSLVCEFGISFLDQKEDGGLAVEDVDPGEQQRKSRGAQWVPGS